MAINAYNPRKGAGMKFVVSDTIKDMQSKIVMRAMSLT